MTLLSNMNVGKALAATMIIISIGACIGYAAAGDVRKSIYWGAAAVINFVVTF